MTIEIDAVFGGGYGKKETRKFETAELALEFLSASLERKTGRSFDVLAVRLPEKPKVEITAELLRDVISATDFGNGNGVGPVWFVQELVINKVCILPGIGHVILKHGTAFNESGIPEVIFSVNGEKLFKATGRRDSTGSMNWNDFKNLKEVTARKVVTEVYE